MSTTNNTQKGLKKLKLLPDHVLFLTMEGIHNLCGLIQINEIHIFLSQIQPHNLLHFFVTQKKTTQYSFSMKLDWFDDYGVAILLWAIESLSRLEI